MNFKLKKQKNAKIEIVDLRLPGYADTIVSSTPNHAETQQGTHLQPISRIPYPTPARESCVSREASRKPVTE